LRRLAAEGKSVLLVSHKLEDVDALCDRVTVLRLGRVTGSMARPFETEGLLRMMFGTPPHTPPRSAPPAGSTVLVLDVSCPEAVPVLWIAASRSARASNGLAGLEAAARMCS
jgi:simple sugar transport system ATP-binding protein